MLRSIAPAVTRIYLDHNATTPPSAAVVEGMKAVRAAGSSAQMVTLSNNASAGFIKDLGDAGHGVIVSQVFPYERSIAKPIIKEALELARKANAELTPSMVEGFVAAKVLVFIVLAASFDLLLGYTGIVSFAHTMFFGLGAYTAGIVSKHGIGEPLVLLVLGAAVAGIAGYLTSFIIARFRHLALIMITLGICLLLFEAANLAGWLTGGALAFSASVSGARWPR